MPINQEQIDKTKAQGVTVPNYVRVPIDSRFRMFRRKANALSSRYDESSRYFGLVGGGEFEGEEDAYVTKKLGEELKRTMEQLGLTVTIIDYMYHELSVREQCRMIGLGIDDFVNETPAADIEAQWVHQLLET